MAKTRQQKITGIDEEVAKLLAEKEKLLAQQHEIDEKARLSRYKKRMELFEKLLPDTIELTHAQFQSFIEKTTANDFGRRILAGFAADGKNPPADKPAEKTAQNAHTGTPQGAQSAGRDNSTHTPKQPQTAQQNAHTGAPQGTPSAGRDNSTHTPKQPQTAQQGGTGGGGENGNGAGATS